MFLNGVVGELLRGIWLWLFVIPWTVACQAPLSMEFQTIDWFDLLAVQGILKGLATPQFKSIESLALSFLYGPTLISIQDYWKNHSFD